ERVTQAATNPHGTQVKAAKHEPVGPVVAHVLAKTVDAVSLYTNDRRLSLTAPQRLQHERAHLHRQRQQRFKTSGEAHHDTEALPASGDLRFDYRGVGHRSAGRRHRRTAHRAPAANSPAMPPPRPRLRVPSGCSPVGIEAHYAAAGSADPGAGGAPRL